MALSPSSFHKRYMSSYETPSSSSSPTSSPTLPLRKRYRCTSKLIVDTNTESDELEDEGTDSKTASEGQQQSVPTEDTAEDEPLGLGYDVARRHALERAGDTVPNTYEMGQSSRSTPVRHTSSAFTSSDPTITSWDTSITRVVPRVPPVSQVIPSPVATPAPTVELDEGALLEIGAQLELHGSTIWRPILALEAWAGYTDAQRAALWQSIYEDQWEIYDLRMQRAADQREM
ncbi:hypothetical protein Tco_0751632 [Tanacetum coccineum]|uniref:Uncharacterized protein n=1 Tax=Tanacetum coccineum TaxID=301880 RepID=A0ABQ4Z658_9ASTR